MSKITTKQLAEQAGCTPQTIRNKARELGILEGKSEGRISFTSEQAATIAEALGVSLTPAEEEKPESGHASKEPVNPIDNVLVEQIEFMRREIENQQETIAALITEVSNLTTANEKQAETIKELAESNKALSAANAIHTAADKREELLLPDPSDETGPCDTKGEEPKKQGFFARLFGRIS